MRLSEILLVEDNRDDELLKLEALRISGVANPVFVVRDGQEALDYLFREGLFAHRDENEKPCVVLLDLKLPKIGGLDVLKRLKLDRNARAIPVVILTTSSEQEDIERSYDAWANSYVRKPLAFDKFVEAIEHLGFYWTRVNVPTE